MSGSPAGEKDRLAEAVRSKYKKITIDGREITLRKWGLENSFKLTSKFTKIFKSVMDIFKDFAKADMAEVILSQYAPVKEILVETLLAGEDFKDRETCEAFVDEAGMEGAIDLLSEIAEMNLRPLGGRLQGISGILGIVGGVTGTLRGGRPQQTRSPISSGPDSTTEQSPESGASKSSSSSVRPSDDQTPEGSSKKG